MTKPDHHHLAAERLVEARKRVAAQNDRALALFFDALFAGADADDLLIADGEALARIAGAAKNVLDGHAAGAIDVRLLPGPDSHEPQDMLVAVNDDRPFLFDTALARRRRVWRTHPRRLPSHRYA